MSYREYEDLESTQPLEVIEMSPTKLMKEVYNAHIKFGKSEKEAMKIALRLKNGVPPEAEPKTFEEAYAEYEDLELDETVEIPQLDLITVERVDRVIGYEELEDVLERAYQQAAAGKGAERHATGQAFHEQPMQTISDLVQSADGMAFQAIKKIQESKRLPTREAKVRELLGAINYIAGMVIFIEKQDE